MDLDPRSESLQKILIDFGGSTFYRIGVPEKNNEKTNTSKSTFFYLRIEQDLRKSLLMDNYYLKNKFKKWKLNTQVQLLYKYQHFFDKWIKMYTFKVNRKNREKQNTLKILRKWRLISKETILINNLVELKSLLAINKWFNRARDFGISRKISFIFDISIKRKFFEIMKDTYLENSQERKYEAVNNYILLRNQYNHFGTWREKYLECTHPVSREQFLIQSKFDLWEHHFFIRKQISELYNNLLYKTMWQSQLHAFVEWKKQFYFSQKMKIFSSINHWSDIADRIIKKRKFENLKNQYTKRSFFKKLLISQRKHEIARREVKEIARQKGIACEELSKRYNAYRHLLKWKMSTQVRRDSMSITFLQQNVFNPATLKKFYVIWIKKLQKSTKEKHKRAIKMRKILLKKRTFVLWKKYVRVQVEETQRLIEAFKDSF